MRGSLKQDCAVFFTETHDWVQVEGFIATVGIGEKAKKEFGDIVYLQLPKVGDLVLKDEPACVLESTKAAIDIAAPISGVVTEVNLQMQQNPSLLNQEKNFSDWLYKVSLQEYSQVETLTPIDKYTRSEKS